MQQQNRFAFKEWAVVCEALDAGLQSVILRKGGIHEGREGFRVDHREFWLFPTEFHQQPDVLTPAAHPLLEQVKRAGHPPGTVAIRNYVVVEDVIEIHDESQLPRLAGLHVWSETTLQARFRYRTPMLFALLVRVLRLPDRLIIAEAPHFAGCRSWVDLPDAIDTAELTPVLSDQQHLENLRLIRSAIG